MPESANHVAPELASSPGAFQRPDGTSVFRPKHSMVFSSEALLGAEDRLLALAHDRSGPAVALDVLERITRHPDARGRMRGAGCLVRIKLPRWRPSRCPGS